MLCGERTQISKSAFLLRARAASLLAIAHSDIAQNYRQELGLQDQPYAVVALGASIPRRAWPVWAFAELAYRELLTRNWRIVLVGGPELAALASEFKKYVGEDLVDLTGKTDFQRLVAICGRANCFVGNDSGPSHIAGAGGVPTLVVTAFASSSPVTHHASPARSHRWDHSLAWYNRKYSCHPAKYVVRRPRLIVSSRSQSRKQRSHCRKFWLMRL
jgi:ADP-heptose:LPS heptosyltransferase